MVCLFCFVLPEERKIIKAEEGKNIINEYEQETMKWKNKVLRNKIP